MNLIDKRIVVTGGAGFLGSHIVDSLRRKNCKSENIFVPRSATYDLRTYKGVLAMYYTFKPDVVIHAAAHVGGIHLNEVKPAELFYDNMIMGVLLLEEARKIKVKKFVQIGTTCEYPKYSNGPFREEHLWDGYPEETNAPYGIAKKALLVQGQAYRRQYGLDVVHLLPVNLYGPRDNFDPDTSHVAAALIKKFVEAQQSGLSAVSVWGTGQASREFLYVEDAADGIVMATELYDGLGPINIGTGINVTILALAEMIAKKVGYAGEIVFDSSKPDGQLYRCLDVQKAQKEFGFEARTSLEDGLDETIAWYKQWRAKA